MEVESFVLSRSLDLIANVSSIFLEKLNRSLIMNLRVLGLYVVGSVKLMVMVEHAAFKASSW